MRRLPADRSLAALLRATRLAPVQVELLAQRLAEFYHRLPPLTIRAREYRVGIEEHVQANRSELLSEDHGLDPLLVKRVHAAQFRVLRLAPELLEHRACDGRVVEGHGDLRPEHIYCAPEPLAIDCIEFSAELRYLDVLDDLSFLAMECDYLGAGPVGDRILERYVQVSGDRPPRCLVPFYKSYRASVHAKVAALRSRQDEGGEHQDELRLADRYLRLADTYGSQLGPPLVIVVRGLAGSGKSTLAETLSDTLGLEWLQTDGVRRQLLPSEAWSSVVERESYPVYAELLRQAEGLLDQQCSVILDGTFLSSHLVQQAVDLARARQALPLVVECSCPTAVAQQRIRWRLRTEVSLSEATPGLYADQRHAWEPVPHGVSSLKISTTASLPSLIEQVLRYLRESPPLRDILAAP
jgi:predicted kinase